MEDSASKVNQETKVVNVKKKYLNILGYKDFQEWIRDPNNVYIGRNMSFYVPGANGSKWGNPFHVKKYGRMQCVQMYKDHVKYDLKKYDGKTLWESLDELEGKTLGCWCHPDPCHGHVLLEILQERRENMSCSPDIGTATSPETTTSSLPPGLNPEMVQSPTTKPMSKSAKKNAKRKEKRKRERDRVEDSEEYDAGQRSDCPYFYTPPYKTSL